YVDWLLAQDMRPAYAYFKLQLQAILHQRGGGTLVLKDPCHLWHLDALLETFPDARVIQLHRPPEQVVGSFASLCHALHEAGAAPRSKHQTGSFALELLERGLERVDAVRGTLAADRIFDLDYRDLVGDPLGTLDRIHARVGRRFDASARAGAEAWL